MKQTFSGILASIVNWIKNITWAGLAVGLGCAILLAIMGEVVLVANLGTTLGVSLFAAAILLFTVIVGAAGKLPPPGDDDLVVIRQYVIPFILIAASLALLAYILPRVENIRLDRWQNYYTFAGWVVSILLFSSGVLVATRWRFPGIHSIGQFLRENKWEALIVIGLFLLALFLRIYKLDQIPYPFLKDEAWVGREALYILNGNFSNLFQPGWQVDPLLNSAPMALSIRIFGNTIFGSRLAPVLFGTFTVILLYFLTRSMFDQLTAFLAALCMAAIPPHIHFSRMGVSNITVAFWACFVFWLTYRAIQKGRASDYLWAGIVTGLPLYSYLGSRLMSAIGAGMILFAILTQRNYLRTQWKNLLVYGVILSIVVAPTLYISYMHPETFIARFHSDNIFSNHWLISEPVNSGRSMSAALLDQFNRSTMVFVSLSAWGGFYNSPKPFLLPVAAVLLVFGFGYSIFRVRELRHTLVQVWFWSIVIIGSTIFAIAPNAERMVGGLPAAALLAAIGLAKIVELLKLMKLASPSVLNGLAAGIMAIASLQNGYYYLVEYQQTRVFAHPYEEFETDTSLYAAKLGPDYRMYMLITLPLEVIHFPAHDYLAYDIEAIQLDTIDSEVLQALPKDKGMVFFAIPEKRAELEQVAEFFPGGKWREVPMVPIPSQPPAVMYYSYEIPAP
ncbi:MAG: glycosyltransferase family 39 protein [Chloroflexi bacterium]|nr:glycosyltransferase family 39 protein [Chloroflexota bacterium]